MSQSKSHMPSLARPLPNCAEGLFASFCGSIDAKSPANQRVTFTALAVSYWLFGNGGSTPGGSRCLPAAPSYVSPTFDWCAANPAFLLLQGMLDIKRRCCVFLFFFFVIVQLVVCGAKQTSAEEISCEQIHMEADSRWHAHVLQPKYNIHTAPCFYLWFFFISKHCFDTSLLIAVMLPCWFIDNLWCNCPGFIEQLVWKFFFLSQIYHSLLSDSVPDNDLPNQWCTDCARTYTGQIYSQDM